MEHNGNSLKSTLTPALRLFLVGEFFIKLSSMYGLFLPIFMTELGATVVDIGLAYTLSDIVPLVINIIGGWLSDRFGRLRTIAWGNVLNLFAFAMMIFAKQWEWMILVFSLIGISQALGGPSFAAFIADSTAEENRAKVYAVQQNVQNVINLVKFPLAGLIVARSSFQVMLLVAAIFFIIGTAILAVLEWTTKQKVAKDEITPDNPPFTKSFALIISLIFAGGLFTWLFIIDHANDILVGLSHPLQVLYFEEVVGVNVEQIGYLPTIGAIVALFVTVPLGYWVDKHGENLGMGLAYFLLIFHLGIPLVARNFLGLIPSALVHPFMIGLAAPASLSLISKAIPEEQRGIAFGITWTSRGIISLPSPYLGGLLWDRFSPRTPFLITILGCLGLSIMAFLKLKIPKEESVNVS